jgi:hypothetical protein
MTIEALSKNELSSETTVYIFSDAPKNPEQTENVMQVRDYLGKINCFKSMEIRQREKNFGLAKSVITGVTEIIKKHGKVIVLEDDMVTSKYFLTYMNNALDLYENEADVACIHGYVYPVKSRLPDTFFLKGADCWGWATWKRGWDIFEEDGKKLLDEIRQNKLEKQFNFNDSYPYTAMLEGQVNGEINSWAIRWYASAFVNNKLTLYPGHSLVKNIGNDGSGTNCTEQTEFDVEVYEEKPLLEKIKIEHDKKAFKKFEKYFTKRFNYKRNILRKMLSRIKSVLIH